MRISNSAYDIIKFIAINLIPSLTTLILALGDIWKIPYYVEIGATISAIGIFLAGIIKMSKDTYLKDKEADDEQLPTC